MLLILHAGGLEVATISIRSARDAVITSSGGWLKVSDPMYRLISATTSKGSGSVRKLPESTTPCRWSGRSQGTGSDRITAKA